MVEREKEYTAEHAVGCGARAVGGDGVCGVEHVVGCGDVCEVKSGPAFQKAEGSELVAVMRRDAGKAEVAGS